MSDVVYIAYAILGLLFGLGGLLRRKRTFRIEGNIVHREGEHTKVKFQAGPYRWQNVKVEGVPPEGTTLEFSRRGLVGRMNKGHYAIGSVDSANHTATAFWKVN